jgi:hypothetical protein
MFDIVNIIDKGLAWNVVKKASMTKHSKDRLSRMEVYNSLFNEGVRMIGCYEVNKGHENGNEYHVIYSNRITKVYNVNSKKFITCVYLRDAQIERYGLDAQDFEKFIQGLNNI